MKFGRLVAVALVAALSTALPASSRAQGDVAKLAHDLISGLDLDAAGHLLSATDSDSAAVALERARLALYELDCDTASTILGRPDVAKTDDGEFLAEIARGCRRVTAAVAIDRDDALGIEVRWQDESDAALAPILFETVARARDALSRDLGVEWPRPTRIVVVRDLLSLSAMTGLPYASANATGTVAVAKWGRVTLLSPRATPHGYMWRDTVAHELTHLAVTRMSRDRAPLWLQEGVAKNEEVRWRAPQPLDDSPPADAVAFRGIESGVGFALDKLGPSIAMLPNADAATVAFAEVTSFVRYYLAREGTGALPKLLRALRDAPDVDSALASTGGANLKTWDARWRAALPEQPRSRTPLPWGLGERPKNHREDAKAFREQRDRARLAELLVSRGHAPSAIEEFAKLDEASKGMSAELRAEQARDPALRWLRGISLEESADDAEHAKARALFDDVRDVSSLYGPWCASRGRWARARGDEEGAAVSFSQAVASDPFEPEVACEARPDDAEAIGRSAEPMCVAARAWSPSPFSD
jgi:hypothetical protein